MIDKNKIKIVLFDIDNTLSYGDKAKEFYSQYSRCLEKTLADTLKITVEEAKKIADVYREKYNGHGEKSFSDLNIGMDVWFRGILTLDPDIFLEPLEKSNKLIEALKYLGFTVGAITDGPTIQASRILKAIQVREELFDFIIGWERGGNMPKYGDKKIYQEVCEKYNTRPDEIIMIGDSLETDILPAREVGLETIHITDLNMDNQDKRVKNIEKLYDLILVENNLK